MRLLGMEVGHGRSIKGKGVRNPGSPLKPIRSVVSTVKKGVASVRDAKVNVAREKFRRQKGFPNAFKFEKY
jgi:hypothetical protein